MSDDGVGADKTNDGPRTVRFVIRRQPRERLDKYLRQRLKRISRHQIQKLIDAGGVTINDRVAKASAHVHRNDVLDVILPPPPARYLQPEPIPLDILYEDEHFIVVNKQAGLVIHPARSHLSGTLVNALAHHLACRSTALQTRGPGNFSSVGADIRRPGIVHRLDKNTTGVIVVAKRDTVHWRIARQFEDRSVLKAYLALVHGEIEGIGGVVDEAIGKHPTIREAYAVRRDSTGKSSVTLYRVRERYRGYTLVELELKSGRTHQIRVHLAYIGHPIAGDILYGGEPVGWPQLDDPPVPMGSRRFLPYARSRDEAEQLEAESDRRDDLIMRHAALHAALLRLVHPVTNQPMTFTAPLHEPMVTLVRQLRQRPAPGQVAGEGYWVDVAAALMRGQ